MLTQEVKNKFAEKLKEKKVKLVCPMCGNKSFTLIDWYFNPTIQENLFQGVILGGSTVPAIAISCNNCGFISHHALGVLGLLSELKGGEDATGK